MTHNTELAGRGEDTVAFRHLCVLLILICSWDWRSPQHNLGSSRSLPKLWQGLWVTLWTIALLGISAVPFTVDPDTRAYEVDFHSVCAGGSYSWQHIRCLGSLYTAPVLLPGTQGGSSSGDLTCSIYVGPDAIPTYSVWVILYSTSNPTNSSGTARRR